MNKDRIPPIHPGEMLRLEFLEPLGISQNRLALTMRVPPDRINAIVQCKRGITADTAMRLGIALKVSPEFWLSLQSKYDLEMARIKSEEQVIKEVIPLIV